MSDSTLQASLPMYDFPETRASNEAWWRGIAKYMKQQGIADVPDNLQGVSPVNDLWQNQHLFMSQCCGRNIIHGYDKTLTVLMLTDWEAAGCETGKYASYLVTHEDNSHENISQFNDSVAVINGPESHSGMTTLLDEAQPHSVDGHFFKAILISGAHVESLAFIRSKQADIAAIDCVTFALMKRYRPKALEGIKVIGQSKPAPSLPYVTSTHTSLATQQRMQAALAQAFADPELADVREALLLKGAFFPDLTGSEKPYEAITETFTFDSRLLDALKA